MVNPMVSMHTSGTATDPSSSNGARTSALALPPDSSGLTLGAADVAASAPTIAPTSKRVSVTAPAPASGAPASIPALADADGTVAVDVGRRSSSGISTPGSVEDNTGVRLGRSSSILTLVSQRSGVTVEQIFKKALYVVRY